MATVYGKGKLARLATSGKPSPPAATPTATATSAPTPPYLAPTPFDGLVPSSKRPSVPARLTLADIDQLSPLAGLILRRPKPKTKG